LEPRRQCDNPWLVFIFRQERYTSFVCASFHCGPEGWREQHENWEKSDWMAVHVEDRILMTRMYQDYRGWCVLEILSRVRVMRRVVDSSSATWKSSVRPSCSRTFVASKATGRISSR
jgi:hypothetical protein